MLESVLTDLRYATRKWRRAPSVTVAVTVAVALGIAATTAIFSVMQAVFLRPLPLPASEQLVRFSTTVGNLGRVPEVNYLDARDWRAASTRLQALGLYDVEAGTVRLADDAPLVSATLMLVTEEVLPVLGIRPAWGRALVPDDYRFGPPSGVMLGNRFWKTHFGGDASAVGRTIQTGAGRRTIVGVLPPEADRFPAGGADLWMALTFPPSSFLNQRGSIALAAIGRLRGDTTLAAAQDEIATIAARLASTYPDTNRDRAVHLDRLQEAMVGPIKPMMLLFGLSVAMLLAVACANIANLLLAQTHARRAGVCDPRGARRDAGAHRAADVDRNPRALWRRWRARRGDRAAARVVAGGAISGNASARGGREARRPRPRGRRRLHPGRRASRGPSAGAPPA